MCVEWGRCVYAPPPLCTYTHLPHSAHTHTSPTLRTHPHSTHTSPLCTHTHSLHLHILALRKTLLHSLHSFLQTPSPFPLCVCSFHRVWQKTVRAAIEVLKEHEVQENKIFSHQPLSPLHKVSSFPWTCQTFMCSY